MLWLRQKLLSLPRLKTQQPRPLLVSLLTELSPLTVGKQYKSHTLQKTIFFSSATLLHTNCCNSDSLQAGLNKHSINLGGTYRNQKQDGNSKKDWKYVHFAKQFTNTSHFCQNFGLSVSSLAKAPICKLELEIQTVNFHMFHIQVQI